MREPLVDSRLAQPTWRPPAGRVKTGPLAVRVLGQGAPTLLLHGLLGSNRYWGAAFDRLAARGLLLAPDLLGFGASPRPPSGYGPSEHGRAVFASLGDQQVSQKVLVVGHSLGALLAIWMACDRPDLVRGVVALAPPIFRDTADARRRIGRLGGVERLFASDSAVGTWIAKTACTNLCGARPRLAARLYSRLRPELPFPLVEDSTQHSWVSYSETLKRLILSAEAATWLRSARPPILIVGGTRDRYLDVDFLRELAGGQPNVRLSLWEGQGHDLPLTDPERCLAAVESWSFRA